MSSTPPGFRTEPNREVSTASPAAVGADFKSADRQAGWLVVNKRTYKILRASTKLFLPKVDQAGLSVTDAPSVGRGMRIVRPETTTGTGAVFLIHGGGYVAGRPAEAMMVAAPLAQQTGVPIFCPGYRLAPEDPFPAGLDDCHAAWHWLLDNAESYGVDPAKIVLGGISAGGGHAASLVQRIHDEGGTQPAGQLLVYPMLDDRTAADRSIDKPRHRVWSNQNNLFGWTSYLGHAPGQDCVDYVVPARREDLTGLPPAWIGVGGADLFLDEDREYAQRLEAAGVEVSYVEIDGGIHAFDAARNAPLTKAFYQSAATFVSDLTR